MIHVFIGTKAQFIKMAPVLRALDSMGVQYNLIDTGQHWEITQALAVLFDLREPDVSLRPKGKNISTLSQAAIWFLSSLLLYLFNKRKIREWIFRGQGGICLVHGDTLTTLVSALFAKRVGIKVAHVEAGLRSFNFLHPFPEELIRVIVMYLSDVLFAPNDLAFQNLVKMKVRGQIVNTQENTVFDALEYVSKKLTHIPEVSRPYALVTAHRAELVLSHRRLEFLLKALEAIPPDLSIVFVMHDVTLNQLKRFRLLKKLEELPNVYILPLQGYAEFQALLQRAQFLITDGGSIQEEAEILQVPCLILRKHTERKVGTNAMLAGYDLERVRYFLKNYENFRGQPSLNVYSPSKQIADFVRVWNDSRG